MDQYHYDDGPSSSSAPPPPYSISAPGSGSFAGSFDGPASSSLHPPVPTSSHRASGATPEKTSHTSSSAGGFLDSKRRLADPRSSSAQSLAPSLEDRDGDARRTLLIIYIHGFYGNESSFRSFPAHVHNFLKDTLVESHVIHSKIYPRYKTYKAIDVARDNFSQWLEPHESDKTDVILVGHSMGGILAGEVALMSSDPWFNPPFWNDAKFKDRPFMRRIGHFAKKHRAEGVWDPIKNHLMSHLEYGGCLADYKGLNQRYNRLRALEDIDPLQHLKQNNGQGANANQLPPSARVRFINYYTLSSGRPKKPKSPKTPDSPRSPDHDIAGQMSTLDVNSQLSPHGSSTPRISVDSSDGEHFEIISSIEAVDRKLSTLHEEQQKQSENKMDDGTAEKKPESKGKEKEVPEGQEPKGKQKEAADREETGEPSKVEENEPISGEATPAEPVQPETPADFDLPPIPDLPPQPTPPDLDKYTDKDARKQAEKEGKRAQKAYDQAVKSREKAIKERQKLVEKRRKKAEKEAQKEAQRVEKEEQKRRQQEELGQAKSREDALRAVEAAQRRAEAAQRELEAAQRQVEATQRETDAARRQQPAVKPEAAEQQQKAVEMSDSESEPESPTGSLTQVDPRPISQDGPQTPLAPPPQPRAPPPALPPRMPSSSSTAQTAPASSSASLAPTQSRESGTSSRGPAPAGATPQQPKKQRKFCMLPSKTNGRRDETWVPVYMEGMDEVGAHCGLFVPGPHYDRLIGDMGERILGWVQEDMTARAILEMS
ncbi:Reticulocyte-binding protein 2-like protein a [Colletotrichum sp. SAR 10_65]|nr:Reticulocyte-binding protein 2-like protein a [Colletotrichum sp. SAR 10_65]